MNALTEDQVARNYLSTRASIYGNNNPPQYQAPANSDEARARGWIKVPMNLSQGYVTPGQRQLYYDPITGDYVGKLGTVKSEAFFNSPATLEWQKTHFRG
jgi:hypothetical protein